MGETMTDAALHLVPNAGDPQEHPGPECQGWSRPLRPSAEHGLLWDWCAGCYGAHPRKFTTRGWMIPAHTPSPPQHHECSVCYGPMVPPSYTPAPHPWCTPGEADTDGYGE